MSPDKKKAGIPPFTIDPGQFQYEVAEEIAAGTKTKKREREAQQKTRAVPPQRRTSPAAPGE